MLTRNLLGFLSIWTFHQVTTQNYYDDFAPRFAVSKGEPWPLPRERYLYPGFQILNPFTILYSFDGNDQILFEAIARYRDIIRKEAEIGYRASKHKTNKTLIRNDPNYSGRIMTIAFNVPLTDGKHPHLHMDEHYTIIINRSSQISIQATSVWGALRALETFSQLLIPSEESFDMIIQLQTIYDKPKFPHRGLMLDTSRHFLPLADISMILDGMAYNKLNVFHWHIVDDDSFPYQSIAFPELSERGAWHPAIVYTPDDIRHVIEYARLRGIRVIPEFDTPGHVRSWGKSHPEFLTTCYDTTGKPNGTLGPLNPIHPRIWKFLSTFFDEVSALFDDDFIHIGGNDVPHDCWKSNPEIVSYMSANSIQYFAHLHGAYTKNILNVTTRNEKKSVVWNEVFDTGEKLPLDTIIQVWTGTWKTKLETITKAGHPVILSACWNLDQFDSEVNWKKYYDCDPLDFTGSDSVKHLILGGEASMWSKFVDSDNIHQRLWPSASSTAERLWSHSIDTLDNAAHRLEIHACRMKRRNIPTQPANGPGFCFV